MEFSSQAPRYLFFDLDGTLWDFDANSVTALRILYTQYELGQFFESEAQFLDGFHRHNAEQWRLYRLRKVNKESLRVKRFLNIFVEHNIHHPKLARKLSDDYLTIASVQKALIPGVEELLPKLHGKIPMGILTNGFREAQWLKITASGLDKYIDLFICAEDIGYLKPHKAIFTHAASRAKIHQSKNCILIGDEVDTDIKGALNAGWKTFYYNPLQKTPPEGAVSLKKIADLYSYLF